MTATFDLQLAASLVDELERLGAKLSFFTNDYDDEVCFTWACQGVANFQRCRAIFRLALVENKFGQAFSDEIEERYLAGRMRVAAEWASGPRRDA